MEIKSMFDIVYPFVSINNENPDDNEEIMQENINKISNFLSKIKLHNMINLDEKIRNQFIFLVFQEKKPNVFDTNNPDKLEDFTIMHMFNKIYNNNDKTWHTDNVRYINSFFFSDAMLCENKYDWYQIDKNSLIVNNLDNPTNSFKLIFKESQNSVTPGQAAVFYKGEILLGGGIIN